MEKQIIKLLNSYGFDAWICGGTARDIYMKRPILNYDIAVCGTLAELQEVLKSKIINVNEYSTSLTIKFKDKEFILYPLKKIELINTYYNFTFTKSLKEDAASRDLTINSLYYNPLTKEWFDYYNSKKDINKKILRFVGDPTTRILESKIRILRLIVTAAILGEEWKIDDQTAKAIYENRLRLVPVNSRQISTEITKLFKYSAKPSIAFKLMRRFYILEDFFPELQQCISVEQSNKSPGLDLYNHIMYCLDAVQPHKANSFLLRFAALLHDIGKPYTKITTDTGLHFYNHENIGAYIAERILFRWGFSRNFINKVTLLIVNHLFDATPYKSNASIRKLIYKVGSNNIHDLLDLRVIDRLGTGRKDISLANIEKLRNKINAALLILDPKHFKLQMLDEEIRTIISNTTAIADQTVPTIKQYLEQKILAGRLQNKTTNLKQAILKINKINCPLDKEHLFKTWTALQNGSADLFPNGNLKCGVFCNFICNKHLLKE